MVDPTPADAGPPPPGPAAPDRPAPRARRDAGFTLVEFGLVVVLIAAVTAIVWVSSSRISRQGDAIACRDELREVKVAVQNFASLTGRPPDRTTQLVRQPDPVRGGRILDEAPQWYAVEIDGTVVRRDGAPGYCPEP